MTYRCTFTQDSIYTFNLGGCEWDIEYQLSDIPQHSYAVVNTYFDNVLKKTWIALKVLDAKAFNAAIESAEFLSFWSEEGDVVADPAYRNQPHW